MARKSSKAKGMRTTIHLPADVAAAADQIETATGWSQAAALAFVYRAGVDALYRQGQGLPAMRALLDAQTEHQAVISSTQSLAASSAGQLRKARKQLADALPEAMPLPPRPPRRSAGLAAAVGGGAQPGKRGPYKPRKAAAAAAGDVAGQVKMEHAPTLPASSGEQ